MMAEKVTTSTFESGVESRFVKKPCFLFLADHTSKASVTRAVVCVLSVIFFVQAVGLCQFGRLCGLDVTETKRSFDVCCQLAILSSLARNTGFLG